MVTSDAERLADLIWHWGDAYLISHTNGEWCALSKTIPAGDALIAATADELRQMMRHDNWERKHH